MLNKTDRNALAKRLRRLRAFERQFAVTDARRNENRDRSLSSYRNYLRGIDATLAYVTGLPNRVLVDIGTGTGRALAEIGASDLGKDLSLIGTGILWHPSIAVDDYRITPAEIMRGIDAASVGGIMSVFGPLHYSEHPEEVLEQMHRILIPGGVLKVSVMKHVPRPESAENNKYFSAVCELLNAFCREHHYDFSQRDRQIAGRMGTSRAFLAIKPGEAQCSPGFAESLMAQDEQSIAVTK